MKAFMRQTPKNPQEHHPLAAMTKYYGGLKKKERRTKDAQGGNTVWVDVLVCAGEIRVL